MQPSKFLIGARSRRRSGALAVAATVVAIGLAACGGSSPTPHVASLATTTSRTTATSNSDSGTGTATATRSGSTTTLAKRNPTRLVDEWATCMQSHGDPNQADPTIDAYGGINVTIPSAAAASLSNEVHAGADPCNRYMAAAQSALRAANPVAAPPDQAEQVKYVSCLRAHGYPTFPYPQGNSSNFNGTGIDPTSPAFLNSNANKMCGKQIGAPAWWTSGNGPPGDVSVSNFGPNGAPPPNVNTPNRPRPATAGSGAAGGNPGSGAGG